MGLQKAYNARSINNLPTNIVCLFAWRVACFALFSNEVLRATFNLGLNFNHAGK